MIDIHDDRGPVQTADPLDYIRKAMDDAEIVAAVVRLPNGRMGCLVLDPDAGGIVQSLRKCADQLEQTITPAG